MRSISAQEIKRRGISALDKLLENGAVHVIKNNTPKYVVLTEERYRELVEAEEEFYLSRIKSSLEDVKAGRVKRHKNVQSLIEELGLEA